MAGKTELVRIDSRLLGKLREVAVRKHKRLHGALVSEINEAVEKHLKEIGGDVVE